MSTLRLEPKRKPSPTLLIAVLCFGGLLASYMQTLVVPIVGKLPEYLNTSADNASWVITSTLLAAAVVMPIAGRVADMFGKRSVILASIGLMVIGSAISALFDSLIPVIIGRGLQGMAMGVIPVGISLLRDELPPSKIAGAIATMSATLGVGGAIGLPVAAWISQNFNWHVLFLTSAALGAVAFLLVLTLVQESPARSGGTFDAVGAVGLTIALVCLLLALSKGRSWGWTSGLTLGMVAAGLVVFAAWVVYELRTTSPMVNIRVSIGRRVLFTNIVSIVIGFALMGISLASPQLLQLPNIPGVLDYGMGRSIIEAGLWMAPGGLMMMFLSPVSARLNVNIGPKFTLMIGTIVIGLGYLLAVFEAAQPWQIALAVMVTSSGVGIAYSAMPSLIMSAVPLSETASANGLNSLMRSIGTAIASALLATILASSTVDIGSTSVPDRSAFQLVFIVGAIASAVAVALILLIPSDNKNAIPGAQPVDLPENKDDPAESVADEIEDGELSVNGAITYGKHAAPVR
ncbi:MFS transporter [Williamsia maris]|uniref:Drug resistance transporter, EmrB/QacA subfamily n=1 Tax=Williamsia maris TaxID=72806 RepID=A0ABT1HHY8_9NOCA|nr:MFS transporter [Williamsia maris]MCP2176760.1 drug resistance transporter, EmrB/QacA subfamily [Williamsia maris]